jgi:capsular exopolysaccharide synthesis family protein
VPNVVRHLKSLDVMMEVAKQLNPSLEGGYILQSALAIQSRFVASVAGDQSTMIDLSYTDASTAEAERVLYLIIDVYKKKWMDSKRELTKMTSHFIDTRLALLEQDLSIVDDSIATYKSSYGITDLQHVSDIYLKQQTESDAEIMRLISQKTMAEYIRDLLQDESEPHQLLLTNSGIDNNIIESQITLYNNLLLELQNHLKYTSEQNPLVSHQEEQIASLRSKILTNINNHIHSIDIQMDQLIDFHNEATEKVTSNPAQAKYLATIERERMVKESLYMFLLQKKEENEISSTYQSVNTQIIDIPHGSGKPTAPKREKTIFGAILIGLLIPVTVIFLRATISESVQNHHDIDRHPDIPFLGELPMSEREGTITRVKRVLGLMPQNVGLVVSEGKQNPINEAFRLLRTKLKNAMDSQGGVNGVYLICSDQKDAGKTFISMNLAMALAIEKKHVLFIDADLRKASASKRWKTAPQGLTDYLEGRISEISSLIFNPKGFPHLDVLPAGPIPATPTELLDTPFFSNLIEEVRTQYDIIIIDTPPLGLLADAEIIGKHVDRALFVIRAGRYKRGALCKLESPTEHSNGKPLFVILNGVNIDFRYDRIATSRFFKFKNPFKLKKA